jgi:hypothetical protein
MKIYSIHYNKPEYINLQKKLFDKYLNFEFEFIIVNNATNEDMVEKIELESKKEGLRTIKCMNNIKQIGSTSHQNSFKYIIDDLDEIENFLIVDHDVFLIEEIYINYFTNYDMVFLAQTRNEIEYPWPGLIYFSNSIDKSEISFTSGVINGNACDTGAGLYHYISKNKDFKIKKISERHIRLENNIVSKLDDKFIHLIGGSGWNPNINIEEKVNYLNSIIDGKI